MKLILFAAALALGGAAMAQDTTTDTTATDEAQTETTDTTADTADTTQTDTTQTSTMTTTTTTSTGMGTTVAPGNQAPERDARGIPVVSDPATAPAGVNEPVSVPAGSHAVPNPNAAAAFQTQPSTMNYPACSRTVTDHCVQAYERGKRR